MPWRLTDDDFLPQAGLSVTAELPVQQLVPPYAPLFELNARIQAVGGVADGDSLKFVPERAECKPLEGLPHTDRSYANCSCAGAAASDQGSNVVNGVATLPSGIHTLGRHVVCHAFALSGASDRVDLDYEPQRGVSFDGVNRSVAVPLLDPNTTLVHFDTEISIATPHAGYIRLVRLSEAHSQMIAAGVDIASILDASGICDDAASLAGSGGGGVGPGALGGALSDLVVAGGGGEGGGGDAGDGDATSSAAAAASSTGVPTRTLHVKPPTSGTYAACHAFRTLVDTPVEASERFTLQIGVYLVVSYAVSSLSTPLLVLNENTRLRPAGAAAGDFVKFVRQKGTATPATECAGAAASLDGGQLVEAGKIDLRVVDRTLFAPSATYLLCHAFNYTGGDADEDYHTQTVGGDGDLAGVSRMVLNVTVAFPISSLTTLDVNALPARSTARKQLTVRVPSTADNRAVAGDALVLLPASVGNCAGAAALHYRAACDLDPAYGGDFVAASTLTPNAEPRDGVADGVETRLLRLNAGAMLVCHAFAADLFVMPDDDDDDGGSTGAGALAPSPPPPGSTGPICPLPSAYAATDAAFRQQYGVIVNVEYPMTQAVPATVVEGSAERVEVLGGSLGDMVRWVPACELGCGREPSHDPDFPFVTLSANPLTSSPPPPHAPSPPRAPGAPAAPAAPPPPYAGSVSVPSTPPGYVPMQAALYKLCYAYAEDLVLIPGAPGGADARWPQMQHVVEVPLLAGVTSLRVERPHEATAPRPTLSHDAPVELALRHADWAWLRLPLKCDDEDDDVPIAGCRPGAPLAAAVEVDTGFSPQDLRYHSMHMLFAHAPVHQPITSPPAGSGLVAGAAGASAAAIDASQCFDGLDEDRLERLKGGYMLPPGALMVEPEVHGFTQLRLRDRVTFHVGANVSSGGCNGLPADELWIRLRCAVPTSEYIPLCRATVRALLLPISVPPGYEQTIEIPLEPGAPNSASRALLQVGLGDADIVRFTVLTEVTRCGGASEPLPFPSNDTVGFAGSLVVQRDACPRANDHQNGYLEAVAAGGSELHGGELRNTSLEFFCTDHPGMYNLVVDARDQPLHTEGPPTIGDEGLPSGSLAGAPLGEGVCPDSWGALLSGINANRTADRKLSGLPTGWLEGQPNNVLRRGRVLVRLLVYRSKPFGSQPFYDGEMREVCLSHGQTRTFSIYTASPSNATLHLSLDAPISAAYARRDLPPDVANGVYDTRIAIVDTPRWGCTDSACDGPRSRFALTASSCNPAAGGYWYVSLVLRSAAATAAESALATGASAAAATSVRVRPARFHLSMVLYPADLAQVVGAPAPTFTLPSPASADAASVLGPMRTGVGYLGGGTMLHFRLREVPPHLAPHVEVQLTQGTARAVYVQRDRCAASASGLAAANGGGSAADGESASCGPENDASCVVKWLSRFSAFRDAKLHQMGGTLRAPSRSALAAESMPPGDWWLAIEANPEDIADASLTVTLLGQPARTKRLCLLGRFCSDYDDLAKRYADGERDADDPAIYFLRLGKATLYERAQQLGGTSIAFIFAGSFAVSLVLLRWLWNCVKAMLFAPTATSAGYGSLA